MERLKKIERLVSLQAKIHRLQEWRLGQIDRQQAELVDSRLKLIQTLNDPGPLHGLFVDAMARRLALLAREGDRLTRAREVQHRRLQEEGLRLKRFERATGRMQRKALEEARKRGFVLMLDALARADDDASLP
jgi:hypothetical protein